MLTAQIMSMFEIYLFTVISSKCNYFVGESHILCPDCLINSHQCFTVCKYDDIWIIGIQLYPSFIIAHVFQGKYFIQFCVAFSNNIGQRALFDCGRSWVQVLVGQTKDYIIDISCFFTLQAHIIKENEQRLVGLKSG